jgi:hypothetical protein
MTTHTRMTLTRALHAATCDAPLCHTRLSATDASTQVRVRTMPNGRSTIDAFCTPACRDASDAAVLAGTHPVFA